MTVAELLQRMSATELVEWAQLEVIRADERRRAEKKNR